MYLELLWSKTSLMKMQQAHFWRTQWWFSLYRCPQWFPLSGMTVLSVFLHSYSAVDDGSVLTE